MCSCLINVWTSHKSKSVNVLLCQRQLKRWISALKNNERAIIPADVQQYRTRTNGIECHVGIRDPELIFSASENLLPELNVSTGLKVPQHLRLPDVIWGLSKTMAHWFLENPDDFFRTRALAIMIAFCSAEQYRTSCDYSRCVISPGMEYCAAGSTDGHVFIWNTHTTKLEKTLSKGGHEFVSFFSKFCSIFISKWDLGRDGAQVGNTVSAVSNTASNFRNTSEIVLVATSHLLE